ncbi:hypothetical protein B0H19DRAFT_1268387 [Mycena capillaripes]|nr:hypothetical protein B0H19DRAFT_1268387 [Mycena capillaripes]
MNNCDQNTLWDLGSDRLRTYNSTLITTRPVGPCAHHDTLRRAERRQRTLRQELVATRAALVGPTVGNCYHILFPKTPTTEPASLFAIERGA